MPQWPYAFSALLLAWQPAPPQVPAFDLRDLGEVKNEEKETADEGAFERYLHSTGFRNPLGRYAKIDSWKRQKPVVNDDGSLKVAASLINAARDENDAKALASVLAAYRDGADKAPILDEPTGPAITIGGSAKEPERPKRKPPPEPWSGAALPPPLQDIAGEAGEAGEAKNSIEGGAKDSAEDGEDAGETITTIGLATNLRLGARIVSNLAIFRSCSGALINYLDHLGQTDGKALDWTRMIRRSIGVAALPPDDSCLRKD